jgi:hypothetical protein
MNWMIAWAYGAEFMSILDKVSGLFSVTDVRAATLLLGGETAIRR